MEVELCSQAYSWPIVVLLWATFFVCLGLLVVMAYDYCRHGVKRD